MKKAPTETRRRFFSEFNPAEAIRSAEEKLAPP